MSLEQDEKKVWDSLTARQKDRLVHEKVFGLPAMCYGNLVAVGKKLICRSCSEQFDPAIHPSEFTPGNGAHIHADVPHYSKSPTDAWRILGHFRALDENIPEAAWRVARFEHDRKALLEDWMILADSSFCDILCRIAVHVYSLNMNMENPKVADVLAVPIEDNDGDTIGEYLANLLMTLWRKAGDFSAKRPFGEGAWQAVIYAALIEHGFVKGKISSIGSLSGRVVECDYGRADDLIERCVYEMLDAKKA
jgi:hypothetical protein